jgi:hypothetical protein
VKLILESRIITVNGQEEASLAPLVAACLGGHEGIRHSFSREVRMSWLTTLPCPLD